MNADHAFYTGKTHAVCQDYVRSNSQTPYMILCDGCSDPRSPDTDTGARLLALAAERTIKINGKFDSQIAIGMARSAAEACGLHPNCLDATLIVAEKELREKDTVTGFKPVPAISVSIYGDGVVAIKKRDGTLLLHWVEYTTSHPFYLNYRLDQKRKETFAKLTGYDCDHRVVRHTAVISADGKDVKTYRSDFVPTTPKLNSSLLNWGDIRISPEEKAELDKIAPRWLCWGGTTESHYAVAFIEETEWIAISSDGILSVVEKATEPGQSNRVVPIVEVASKLFDFINFKGVFVQRQVNWFERESPKWNWSHGDDLSVAALYVGDE